MSAARNKTNLKKAQKVLQNAHDYVELCGFDINSEGHGLTAEILEQVRKGKLEGVESGAACFIGSARIAAGVNPSDMFQLGTDGGDGPELTIALEIMDESIPRAHRKRAQEKNMRVGSYNRSAGPGGEAEAYGFAIAGALETEHLGPLLWDASEEATAEAYQRVKDGTAQAADKLYKTALRKVHKELEAL